jgi:hypothetical protein
MRHLIRAGVVAAAAVLTLAATAAPSSAAPPPTSAWSVQHEGASGSGTAVRVWQGPLSPFVRVTVAGTVTVPEAGCYRLRVLRNDLPHATLGDACGIGSVAIDGGVYHFASNWQVQLCRLVGDQLGSCGTASAL